ncbi:MAG: YhbY family RNA-binding protein [Oceanococcaceae bacterium]
MPITSAQRRELRAQAHALNPVVQTGGKGVTEAVMAEIEAALTAHALIKVRLAGMEREDRKAAAADIARRLRAELINLIGAVCILYRAPPPKPAAPSPAARPPRPGARNTRERVPGRRGPGRAERGPYGR